MIATFAPGGGFSEEVSFNAETWFGGTEVWAMANGDDNVSATQGIHQTLINPSGMFADAGLCRVISESDSTAKLDHPLHVLDEHQHT